VFGDGMALNSLGVLAAAHYAGIDVHEAAKVIATTPFPPNRQDVFDVELSSGQGNVEIINNCYNNQPAAMMEGINSLKYFATKGRRIAILGDCVTFYTDEMKQEYFSFVKPILEANIDKIILVGEIKIIADALPKEKLIGIYETRKDALDNVDEIASHIRPDDLVLVKVSSTGITANNLALKLVESLG